MFDWFDKIMIAVCVIIGIVLIGCLIFAIMAEPSGEEFDVVGWVANPANPASPLHPKFY